MRPTLGVVPAIGAGLATMAQQGQLGRLRRHFDAYAQDWDVRYFSWLRSDEEENGLPFAIRCWAGPGSVQAALLRPLRERRLWRDLRLVRALNLLGTIPALMARWAFGVPFVFSWGADYEAIARIHARSACHVRRWRWLARVAVSQAAAVLVPSPRLAAQLRERFPAATIVDQPNWVDLRLFGPARAFVADPPRILYVGRLVKEKGLHLLEEAVPTVPRARLRLIGRGPLRAILAAHTWVEAPGAIDWERLPGEYHAAACFALPSLSEGHSKALAEAMACGTPCVVSEQVGGGEESVLKFRTTADLIDRLLWVMANPADAHRLGGTARREAEAKWDHRRLLPQELRCLARAAGLP